MRRRALTAVALVALVFAATMVPAAADTDDRLHANLQKSAMELGPCHEVAAAKNVPIEAVKRWMPDKARLAPTDDGQATVVFRAQKCRWVKVYTGDHASRDLKPTIVQVGVLLEGHRFPDGPLGEGHDLYSLFTVTDSKPIAHALRAGGVKSIYLSDDLHLGMGKAEKCGEEVKFKIRSGGDAPRFKMYGVLNAATPDCERTKVDVTNWWTVTKKAITVVAENARPQALVRSESNAIIVVGRNTRLSKSMDVKRFEADVTAAGYIVRDDVRPDVVVVPYRHVRDKLS